MMKPCLIILTVLVLLAGLMTGCTVQSTTIPASTVAPTSTPNLPSGTGTLQVYVTDPPPPEMDEIWVDVKNLEVHKTGGKWITVDTDPGAFDLKAIEGIEQYLSEKVIEAGKYTQIRLDVNSVKVVVGDDEFMAKVPGDTIKLVGNFEVTANSTTKITLDFNGKESVNVKGNGEYMFKPVIKLLVENPPPVTPIPVPTMTAVAPNSGNQSQALNTTITGTNLTGATAVSFGAGITVTGFAVNSGTQISANISIAAAAAPGARNVSVTTPGGTGTLNNGFTVISSVPAPTVTQLAPNSGNQTQTLDVTITGTNLTGATSVSFGAGITVSNYTVNSGTQITSNITIAAAATPGARNVSVTTPGGTGTLNNGFTVIPSVPAPTVTAVTPNSGNQTRTLNVIITGTDLAGATLVSFGANVTINSFTVDSATQITANITIAADAPVGPRDVSATTPGGTGILTNGFIVALP
jgi:hypothetical protein